MDKAKFAHWLAQQYIEEFTVEDLAYIFCNGHTPITDADIAHYFEGMDPKEALQIKEAINAPR